MLEIFQKKMEKRLEQKTADETKITEPIEDAVTVENQHDPEEIPSHQPQGNTIQLLREHPKVVINIQKRL